MRIVFNRLLTAGSKSGIGHHVAELFRCLQLQAGSDTVVPFPQGWLWRLQAVGARLRPLLESSRPDSRQTSDTLSLSGRLLRWARNAGRQRLESTFRSLCVRQSFDFYHEPNYIPLPADIPTVTSVHDLSLLLHPQWHPLDRVQHFQRCFAEGLKQCVHLLTGSEFIRRQMIRELGLRSEQITCVFNGVRPGLRPLPPDEVRQGLARLGLPPRYLLCLGTLEPRKNILFLLRVYRSLPETLRQEWPLLLVGGWGWNRGEIAAYLEREGKNCGIFHLGYLPEKALPLLYNGARALLFPSLYEGFGLPPVEMLACGGAVLASTIGAVAEIAGRQARLIDPQDVDSWREEIVRVVSEDDWWSALRDGAVEAARPFTWERSAALTWEVYRRLAGQSVPAQRRAG